MFPPKSPKAPSDLALGKGTQNGHLFYRHARFYSLDEIESMLQQVGLEVVDYSSAITQSPSETPLAEGAFEGIAPNASFVCLLSKKTTQ